jgi:HEAT repeat protein
MKTPTGPLSLLVVGLGLAALLVGCGQQGTKPAKVDVNAQLEQLKSPEVNARVQACTALASAGPNAAPAVPALIERLKDQDALVRRLAAYALGQIGPEAKSAVSALKEALNDSDANVIPAAMNALRAIDPDSIKGARISNVQTPKK